MTKTNSIQSFIWTNTKDAWVAFIELIKVLVPVAIGVRVASQLGLIDYIAAILAPLMSLVGLSGEMGIVWATGLLTNIYAGLIALSALDTPLTIGSFTTISTMILIAHSLPLEGAVAKKCGVSITYISILRMAVALIVGAILSFSYGQFAYFSQPISLDWGAPAGADTTLSWAYGELHKMFIVWWIIWFLVIMLSVIKLLDLEKYIAALIKPVLSPLGISSKSDQLVTAAMLLGISYGGALLIAESEKGEISTDEMFRVFTFLGIAHALFEETLLLLAVGAHVSGVLIVRVIAAFVVTWVVIRVMERSELRRRRV